MKRVCFRDGVPFPVAYSFWRLCIYVHSGSRAIALYCLLTQTEPSLIVQETNATFGGACFSFGLDYIIAPWFFGLDQVSKSDIV